MWWYQLNMEYYGTFDTATTDHLRNFLKDKVTTIFFAPNTVAQFLYCAVILFQPSYLRYIITSRAVILLPAPKSPLAAPPCSYIWLPLFLLCAPCLPAPTATKARQRIGDKWDYSGSSPGSKNDPMSPQQYNSQVEFGPCVRLSDVLLALDIASYLSQVYRRQWSDG